MKTRTKAGLSVIAAGVVAFAATSLPAYADYAPSPNDIVAVGGDTPQYDLDFLADGDTLGDPGFNTAGNPYKLVNFNATGDANGRSSYTSTGGTDPTVFSATDVLRAGTHPVQRVQSSGDAATAFLNDTGKPETINFYSTATLPTEAQQQTATANGWGFLHVIELGTDAVQIVTASTTNAPTGLTLHDLLEIYTGAYTQWSQIADIPGYTGPAQAIAPKLPPTSSAIYKTLAADLKAANGGTAPTLSGYTSVQQNDPTAVAGNPNAIVPFSVARLNLFESGYFPDQTKKFGTPQSYPIPAVKSLYSNGAGYSSPVTHYVVFRQSDYNSTTPWQPGSTRNWVQTLLAAGKNGKPFFDTAAGLADLAASGITPNYQDLSGASSG